MTDLTDAGPSTPPDGTGEGRVFISHVEEDAHIALRIADGLEENGYATWCYERDAVPGPSYLLQTARQIEVSAAVVLLISPVALGSHQVTAEVVRAHESARPFIPILIGISHVEFGVRQPEWREALGSSTSIALPAQGVDAILPRICGGLRGLGITPGDGPVARAHRLDLPPPVSTIVRADRSPISRKVVFGAIAAALVVVAAVGLVAAAAGRGGGGGGADVGGRQGQSETPTSVATSTGDAVAAPTTTASETTIATPVPAATPVTSAAEGKPGGAAPTPTAASAPPATAASVPAPTPSTAASPSYASADDTPISTSAGPMDVLDASITDEWCSTSSDECMTASGSERFLVLVLVPADGGSLGGTDGFTAEANGSSVSHSAGQAGTKKVAIDRELDIIEVVYGFVPASAADDDVILRWPANPPLLVTVY